MRRRLQLSFTGLPTVAERKLPPISRYPLTRAVVDAVTGCKGDVQNPTTYGVLGHHQADFELWDAWHRK